MPTAPLYDPAYFFYYGSESQPSTVPGTIYEDYPGLKFTEGYGDEAYNIDPNAIVQRPARQELVEQAHVLAQQYGDIPPLPGGLAPDDAQYVRDLAVFLNRSPYGIPVQGGKYGDNAGDGPGIGSLLSNEFFIAATALAAAGGLAGAYGAFSAAAPAATAAGEVAPAVASSTTAPASGLASLTSSTIPGTSITYGQALKAASLANSLATVAQHPSGGSVGGLIGGVGAGLTGIPFASTVGSFAGRSVGNAIDSPGGEQPVGETGQGVDLATLLPLLLGLGGSGLSLAGAFQGQGNAEQTREQQQQLYQLLLQLANNYQQQVQLYNQQALGTDAQRRGEVQQDIANRQQTFGNRSAIAANLANPALVASGANALYQPLEQATMDDILRAVQRDLAMRGQSDGGAAQRATADAFARIIPQLRQNSVQNYLASQQGALSGYSYPPSGPYTPTPTQPLSAASAFPGVPTYNPYSDLALSRQQGDAFRQLGGQVGNLATLLGLISANSGSPSGGFAPGETLDLYNTIYNPGAGLDFSSAFDPSFALETTDIPYDFGF